MIAFFASLAFLSYCQQVWTQQDNSVTAVAGVDMNLNVRCALSDGYFWSINNLTYGALHVPKEYAVCGARNCDLSTLIIPVVLSEMNGSTFQCVSIDYYQSNTVHLGGVVELTVYVVPSLSGRL